MANAAFWTDPVLEYDLNFQKYNSATLDKSPVYHKKNPKNLKIPAGDQMKEKTPPVRNRR